MDKTSVFLWALNCLEKKSKSSKPVSFLIKSEFKYGDLIPPFLNFPISERKSKNKPQTYAKCKFREIIYKYVK